MARESTTSGSAGTSPRSSTSASSEAPPPAGPESRQEDTIINDAVDMLDGVVDYLAAIFKLERYRFEVRTRRLVTKALILVSGGAVVLLGIVFASVGMSSLLSESLQVPYAGPLIVGGVYLVIGAIALVVAMRKKEN
jgi:hypothetical protein